MFRLAIKGAPHDQGSADAPYDAERCGENTLLAAFTTLFPLGSAQRVIALKEGEEHAGIIFVPDAHVDVSTEGTKQDSVQLLIRLPDTVLIPPMNAKAAANIFETAKAEELAVVESFRTRRVVGLLTKGHLMCRYAEELDKARRDLSGET